MNTSFIDHGRIYDYLKNTSEPDSAELNEILDRARELKGISYAAAERLLMVEKPEHLEKIFETASFIKNEIY
ncbi:MAG TPA: [FeFe] hydrogenase H-cluster radical SAM maturase HydG, partial [bacterium]|nr:[FeFe] hydrogenase H-cluster radical SAM maturase HydG [bacterium]